MIRVCKKQPYVEEVNEFYKPEIFVKAFFKCSKIRPLILPPLDNNSMLGGKKFASESNSLQEVMIFTELSGESGTFLGKEENLVKLFFDFNKMEANSSFESQWVGKDEVDCWKVAHEKAKAELNVAGTNELLIEGILNALKISHGITLSRMVDHDG